MIRRHSIYFVAALAPLLFFSGACRTVLRPEVIDLNQPGWTVNHGNAIWKSSSEARELITDVLFAKHENGRVFLQVSKDVLPMVSVHLLEDQWVVESAVGGRVMGGEGDLPADIVWVQLAGALSERPLALTWDWHSDAVGGTIENAITGEYARVVFIK